MLPLNASKLRYLHGDVAHGADLIQRRSAPLRAVEVPSNLLRRIACDEGRNERVRCLYR